jgi:pyruvate formate lyase activating enzyme
MVLGGIQKSSLIDYPGKVSSVIFFSGCNLDCPFCHNPELAQGKLPSRALDKTEILQFLSQRRGLIDGVVMSGGEPTLQKGLLSMCQAVKDLGFLVKVDTNGCRPKVLKQLLYGGMVDYIAMDIKTDPADYGLLAKNGSVSDDIQNSIRIIMAANIEYEFRTTCVKPFVDEAIIKKITRFIHGAHLYALQHFQEKTLLHPEFFHSKPSHFSETELLRLKEIAESSVKTCIIR